MTVAVYGAWELRAACRELPQEERGWFYDQSPRVVGKWKAVCARCPVRRPCAAWAIPEEEYGGWGGLTEWERRVLRSQIASGEVTLDEVLDAIDSDDS